MKLAILTDIHGNLPALEAVCSAIQLESVDAIYHLGDAISIGPFPVECVDLLLSLPNCHFLMGNHDAWFVHGLPNPQPAWMSDGEVEHQQWVHQQLSIHHKAEMAKWPFKLVETFEGVQLTMLHYALNEASNDFLSIQKSLSPSEFDALFADTYSDIILFGHDHRFVDVNSRSRYINPGSLGCFSEPVARYCIITCENGRFEVQHKYISYDDQPIIDAFEQKQVPDRHLISKIFYGGRFTLCD